MMSHIAEVDRRLKRSVLILVQPHPYHPTGSRARMSSPLPAVQSVRASGVRPVRAG
jgi:hypothetical protein